MARHRRHAEGDRVGPHGHSSDGVDVGRQQRSATSAISRMPSGRHAVCLPSMNHVVGRPDFNVNDPTTHGVRRAGGAPRAGSGSVEVPAAGRVGRRLRHGSTTTRDRGSTSPISTASWPAQPRDPCLGHVARRDDGDHLHAQVEDPCHLGVSDSPSALDLIEDGRHGHVPPHYSVAQAGGTRARSRAGRRRSRAPGRAHRRRRQGEHGRCVDERRSQQLVADGHRCTRPSGPGQLAGIVAQTGGPVSNRLRRQSDGTGVPATVARSHGPGPSRWRHARPHRRRSHRCPTRRVT